MVLNKPPKGCRKPVVHERSDFWSKFSINGWSFFVEKNTTVYKRQWFCMMCLLSRHPFRRFRSEIKCNMEYQKFGNCWRSYIHIPKHQFFGIYLTNKQQDQEGPFLNHPGANSIVNFHHLPDAAAIQIKHPGSRLKSHQWVLVTWEECVCANRHPFIYIVAWLVSCYSQIPWSECFWKMRMS